MSNPKTIYTREVNERVKGFTGSLICASINKRFGDAEYRLVDTNDKSKLEIQSNFINKIISGKLRGAEARRVAVQLFGTNRNPEAPSKIDRIRAEILKKDGSWVRYGKPDKYKEVIEIIDRIQSD